MSLAQREGILGGYPDQTFRPGNSLNHVEAYKLIVETGRVASKEIDNFLLDATESTAGKEWFAKYTKTLQLLDIRFSTGYSEPITRKEFMRIVMQLLVSAGF